ncbi:MAG: phosphotransferase enzyme family protein [Opitutales bacterium]
MRAVADIATVASAFRLPGEFVSAAPYGSGHINDTFAVHQRCGRETRRFLLQRINERVFRDPVALMGNVSRVCAHAQERLRASGRDDAPRRALTLVPTKLGADWHRDEHGGHWRCYLFIEGATGHDVVRDAGQAREAARAFGAFQALLADLPGGRLHETIPGFHDTPSRFAAFRRALEADVHGRAAAATPEIAFALAREGDVSVVVDALAAGVIPERVTHNDTKLNNVLLDDVTGEGICVIDLDTVMPGSALYDFGDLVRTSTSPAAEDETDLAKVEMRLPMFEALVDGYLSAADGFLTAAERRLLPAAGKLITFEIGLRFLTDWLEGDVYFKVRRPEHNLERCRTQFALVRSIESQLPAMEACVASRSR